MAIPLGDIITVLDRAYPPRFAQSWDSVGLVCGDPDQLIDTVTITIDATAEIIHQLPPRALLLAHHPLLLRGVDTIATTTPKGALIHQLIRHESALFSAHTNADAANPGVSDALADQLELDVYDVLDPLPMTSHYDKWVIYVPPASTNHVKESLFQAGAGQLGNYQCCSWTTSGTGQFLPMSGATPTIGQQGILEQLREDRVEIIAPQERRTSLLAALHRAHPYEEPAFDIIELQPIPTPIGIGRIGSLKRPISLSQFVQHVAHKLPKTQWGIRAAGDPHRLVQTIAVCGGAGDSLLHTAQQKDIDVYLTADLRHHPADEHLRQGGPALIDVAHWASEYPWCQQAAKVITSAFDSTLPVQVSSCCTDPWNLAAHLTTE